MMARYRPDGPCIANRPGLDEDDDRMEEGQLGYVLGHQHGPM